MSEDNGVRRFLVVEKVYGAFGHWQGIRAGFRDKKPPERSGTEWGQVLLFE
jgi:hypothetical protein